MNPMLAKLMALKGKSKEMDPAEKEGKLAALSSFSDMAKEAMGHKLGGVKKVTVASNTPQGLEKGLDKAKQIVGHGDDESLEDPTEEASETPDMEAAEGPDDQIQPCDEHSSPEEIDAEIERLMALKAEKEHASTAGHLNA